MPYWSMELSREAMRYARDTNREYRTERGLWLNQHSGSYEAQYVCESALHEAIAEYERSNEWN